MTINLDGGLSVENSIKLIQKISNSPNPHRFNVIDSLLDFLLERINNENTMDKDYSHVKPSIDTLLAKLESLSNLPSNHKLVEVKNKLAQISSKI